MVQLRSLGMTTPPVVGDLLLFRKMPRTSLRSRESQLLVVRTFVVDTNFLIKELIDSLFYKNPQ